MHQPRSDARRTGRPGCALDLRLEAKRAAVDALCASDTATGEAERIRTLQALEKRKLLRYGLLETDLPRLYKLRTRGFFPLPHLHPDDIPPAQRTNGGASLDALAWRLVGAWDYVKFMDEAAARTLPPGYARELNGQSREFRDSSGSMPTPPPGPTLPAHCAGPGNSSPPARRSPKPPGAARPPAPSTNAPVCCTYSTACRVKPKPRFTRRPRSTQTIPSLGTG